MLSTASLVCVDPAQVHAFWPHVRGMLRDALERTGLSDPDEYEHSVLSGHQLLWLAWNGHEIEAAATTHLVRIARRVVCIVTACAGHGLDRWLPLFHAIERYARDENAAAMRIYGRRGWQRVLDGYEIENVIMEKVL